MNKLTTHFWVGLLSAVSLWTIPASAVAADKSAYDLYSWRKAGATYSCYFMAPSSDQPADATAMKASKQAVCGKDQAKNLIMNLPKNTVINWKVDEAQGLTLPSADAVRSVQRFADEYDHKMVLPEKPAPLKN